MMSKQPLITILGARDRNRTRTLVCLVIIANGVPVQYKNALNNANKLVPETGIEPVRPL